MELRKTKKIILQLTIVVVTVLVGFAALRNVQAVAGLSAATPPAAALTGAIYTSASGCNKVNGNLFQAKDDVYLNGGPQGGGSGLSPGSYYVMVTNPSGSAILGKTLTASAQVNSSGAFVQCYQLTAILSSASSGFTSLGYDDTLNNGGEYKVWVSMNRTFPNSETKTDNFKVRGTQSAIGGVKYIDTNANGIFDAGELGLEGVTIKVTLGDNTMVTTQTDKTGTWSLVFPAGTTYTACEVLDPNTDGYTQTGPKDGAQALNLLGGLVATANQDKCWKGIVTAADTASLNFFNVICAPKITCPANVTVECGSSTLPASTGEAMASDICGNPIKVTYLDSFTSGCGITGVITRTWTAEGVLGHKDTCTQTITIMDKTSPVLSATPGDFPVQCLSDVPVAPTITANDACSGGVPVTFSETQSNKGSSCNNVITRTWSAKDDCGNPVSWTQKITVDDKTPPMISDFPASGIEICAGLSVPIPTLTATDNCSSDTVPVIYARSDGKAMTDLYPLGGTIVTAFALDACGNKSEVRTFTVTGRNCAVVSLTQGAWGNGNGKLNGELRTDILNRLITPATSLTIGGSANGLTFVDGSESCILAKMPAGGPAAALSIGSLTINSSCNVPSSILKNGRFNNVFIGQVLTLSLNVRLSGILAGVQICPTMITAKGLPGPDGKLGTIDDLIEAPGADANLDGIPDNYRKVTIPSSIFTALNNLTLPANVNSLLLLANRALNGESVIGTTIADLNAAVDAINNGFDEGRFLITCK